MEGLDSDFLISEDMIFSFFTGVDFCTTTVCFGLLLELEFPSKRLIVFSFSEDFEVSESIFPKFSCAKEISGKRQNPKTAMLKKMSFLKEIGDESSILKLVVYLV